MEVIQGKSSNKKIIVAQEIAFAKVLAGNNKTLRDRAVKKLKKWLRIRGNGKWAFTEDEFIRIWTGLFYCMWMSDKFLVQEELAESISKLIHCFKKNSENALLFIMCFNKRILMEWEGLDQYRIDKFNMLVRRFLRQTFIYCKEKEWDDLILKKLMGIFYDVVLHRDNSLGFVLHFISIYAEEMAKVSKGKLETETVLTMIEPFVKLISMSNEIRIQKEAEEFFNYLMRQTDVGIEFEEKLTAWKQQGFPGRGPQSLKKVQVPNGREENGVDSGSEEEYEDEDDEKEPLDPRAGSVHVFLPQIPLDIDGVLELFKKYEIAKDTNTKGRKMLRCLSQKYMALRKGKFPQRIKKDPILDEKSKKRKRTVKNALELLKFTESLDEGPIRTKELKAINKELQEQSDEEDEEDAGEEQEHLSDDENEEEEEEEEVNHKNVVKKKKLLKPEKRMKNSNIVVQEKKMKTEEISGVNGNEEKLKPTKKKKNSNKVVQEKKIKAEEISETNGNEELKLTKKKKNKKKIKKTENEEEVVVEAKKRKSLNGSRLSEDDAGKLTPVRKAAAKRKILSSWQVQDLDSSSPEYYKIETPKIIRIEKRIEEGSDSEENKEPESVGDEENEEEDKGREEIFPVFWEKAKAKALNKKPNKSPVFVNPFAQVNGEAKSSGSRRISFALDKNMAQENEEYLEEVKNSPKVPFDGSKKPVQSALKSGLSPSPVNPFYRFKKIKFLPQ